MGKFKNVVKSRKTHKQTKWTPKMSSELKHRSFSVNVAIFAVFLPQNNTRFDFVNICLYLLVFIGSL